MPRQAASKAEQNDPCPCSSWKKYRKCCWRDLKLTNLESGDRAAIGKAARDAGHGQIARLMSGHDVRRLPRRSAPRQWQPGDPTQLDRTLLSNQNQRRSVEDTRHPHRSDAGMCPRKNARRRNSCWTSISDHSGCPCRIPSLANSRVKRLISSANITRCSPVIARCTRSCTACAGGLVSVTGTV